MPTSSRTVAAAMFGIGTPELVVIFVVALLVLGPKRLPEVARALGKTLAELRRATSGMAEELTNAKVMLEEETRAINRMASGKPSPEKPPSPPAAESASPPGETSPEAASAAAATAASSEGAA